MRIRTLGLAALMAGSLMGDGVAQSVQDEIQEGRRPDRKWKWISSQAGSSSAGRKT
jgi:hypothetical protein